MEFTSEGILHEGTLYTLEDITTEVNKKKVTESNLVLLKIEWEGGRSFDGAFEYLIYPLDKAKELKEFLVGKEVNFGEIAGKHSEIYGLIEESEVEIVEDVGQIFEFMNKYPSRRYYNHSFIDTLYDHLSCEDKEQLAILDSILEL